MAFSDFDALGKSAQMIPPVAAALLPEPTPRGRGELSQNGRRHRHAAGAFEHGLCSLGIDLRLVAERPEGDDALLQGRIVQVGHPRFDGLVEAFQAKLGLGRAPVQLSDMLPAPIRPLLASIEDRGQDLLQPLGLEQPVLNMVADDGVELRHRDRAAGAACLALPGLDRARIVAIAPALAGAECHGSPALLAEADACQQGRPADDTRRRDLGVANPQMLLHGIECLLIDQARHRDDDDLADRLQHLGLGALVELMLADIGASGQDAVKLTDAPTPTVAGEDAVAVEVIHDGLDTHRA